ncbi:MAG: hypothetical protein IJP21_02755 [Clostridia bacterium]|nr:hypothetical protein [Clostridia bacterium]
MENMFYDVVISEMQEFLSQNGFKEKDGKFANDKSCVSVKYDESRKVYTLLKADLDEEGKFGEEVEISAYLFDETHNKNDAACVAIDFVDTLKKELGVKSVRKNSAGAVDLPTASKGDAVTVNTLTTKLLSVYPQLRETYKTETAEKGKFLYLDFYMTHFVPEIRKTLEGGNKKAIKKLVDLLTNLFVTGDNATSTAVIALLTAAIGKEEARFKAAVEYMADCQNLITCINYQISLLGKNKKFTQALKYND